MAWVDDRIYCHPKLLAVGKSARWTFVAGIAYSAGWGTRGRLERGHQEAIGSTTKLRAELVDAGLWEETEGGAVLIHDWDEHNDKRDERRRKDRERKREARKSRPLSKGTSPRTSAGQSTGRSAGPARVEGSEGSETYEGRTSSVSDTTPAKPAVVSNDGENVYAIGDLAAQALRQAGIGAEA